jgi:hypothetical protein
MRGTPCPCGLNNTVRSVAIEFSKIVINFSSENVPLKTQGLAHFWQYKYANGPGNLVADGQYYR